MTYRSVIAALTIKGYKHITLSKELFGEINCSLTDVLEDSPYLSVWTNGKYVHMTIRMAKSTARLFANKFSDEEETKLAQIVEQVEDFLDVYP